MKNWRLFVWAIKRLKIENNDYKRCWQNNILWWLIDLSGVTAEDILSFMNQVDNELKTRAS